MNICAEIPSNLSSILMARNYFAVSRARKKSWSTCKLQLRPSRLYTMWSNNTLSSKSLFWGVCLTCILKNRQWKDHKMKVINFFIAIARVELWLSAWAKEKSWRERERKREKSRRNDINFTFSVTTSCLGSATNWSRSRVKTPIKHHHIVSFYDLIKNHLICRVTPDEL